jgi:glycosyl transferase family 2
VRYCAALPESVTACVIASDEERRLPACLRSLDFCDQVVVVDGGSRDRTPELARAAGAELIENPWPGFAVQRNVALDHARGDWVLEIDADERVSPALATEIRAMLAEPPAATVRMAALPMRDVFLGRALGPSARYPRYRHRLFRRGAFRHDEARTVHEGLWPDGPVLPFEGELEHLLASTWREALADAVAYARLESRQHGRPGPLGVLEGAVLRPAAKLAYRAVLYGGWRDGVRGLGRIGLECAADSLATLYGLRAGTGEHDGLHSAPPPRVGPVRLVGVGLGRGGAERLTEWLVEAERAGADVALVCGHAAATSIRLRRAPGAGPGALARALDAEDQLRPIDAVVPAGTRERRLLALAPRALRGAVEPLSPAQPAAVAVAGLRERLRED